MYWNVFLLVHFLKNNNISLYFLFYFFFLFASVGTRRRCVAASGRIILPAAVCACVCCAALRRQRLRRKQKAQEAAGFSQFATLSHQKHLTLDISRSIIYSFFRTFQSNKTLMPARPFVVVPSSRRTNVNFCINKVKKFLPLSLPRCLPLTFARAAVSFTTNCICKRTANEYAKIFERVSANERGRERMRGSM